MWSVQVQTRRRYFESALRIVVDVAMINAALMGGILLDEAWDVHVQFGIRSHDFLRFLALTVMFLVVCRAFSASSPLKTARRALNILPSLGLTFASFAALSLLLPAQLSTSWHVLGFSFALSGLFLVSSRIHPQALKTGPSNSSGSMTLRNTRQKNILVIGGAGHIGSALIPQLLAAGYRVRVLDRLVFGEDSIAAVRNHRCFELIEGDFLDINSVVHAMSGMHTVLHLGTVLTHVCNDHTDEEVIQANVIATRLVASCAKSVHVRRFVYASTCAVYAGCREYVDEQSDIHPISLYARVKAACEAELRSIQTKKFHPTILRMGTIYGPGGRSSIEQVLTELIREPIKDGHLTLEASDQKRPLVHVEDVALAITAIVDAPDENVLNEIFNVGSENQQPTLHEVAQLIREHSQRENIELKLSSASHAGCTIGFTKLANSIDFQPRWNVTEGIKHLADSINRTPQNAPLAMKPFPFRIVTDELDLGLLQDGKEMHSRNDRPLLF